MRHVFKAVKLGWDSETEGVWFDADQYSKEEAEAEFKPIERWGSKNGHDFPYTAYEFDDQIYHRFHYLGLFEDDEMPRNNDDLYNR